MTPQPSSVLKVRTEPLRPRLWQHHRTDQHAEKLRERADLLDKRATLAPKPIGDRLCANATRPPTPGYQQAVGRRADRGMFAWRRCRAPWRRTG
jgi:hypothetical protein